MSMEIINHDYTALEKAKKKRVIDSVMMAKDGSSNIGGGFGGLRSSSFFQIFFNFNNQIY